MTTAIDNNHTDNDYPVHVPRRGLRLCKSVEEYAEAMHCPVEDALQMVNDGYLLAYAYDVETGEPINAGIDIEDGDGDNGEDDIEVAEDGEDTE